MLTARYDDIVKGLQTQIIDRVRIEVLICARDMFKNIAILNGKTDNEAQVRFAFGNPIVTMLCTIHGYFIALKDKLRSSKPGATKRSDISSADKITEKSTVDHICYTFYNGADDMKLAAVIIETKTDSLYFTSAIA